MAGLDAFSCYDIPSAPLDGSAVGADGMSPFAASERLDRGIAVDLASNGLNGHDRSCI